MARIRSPLPSASLKAQDDLIAAVVKALKEEEHPDGPVIFEVPSGDTEFLQVIVVWTRWANLSADVRTRIVTEAYRQLASESPDAVRLERIAMILPVTADQARELSVLPYIVQSNVHQTAAGDDRIEELMKREGALETDTGVELRLPTIEMARQARDRLQTETKDVNPEIRWQISKQVAQIVDY